MMNVKTTESHTTIYTWDYEGMGLFQATLVNGVLVDLRMFRHGSSVNESGLWISSCCDKDDIAYLRHVRDALAELLEILARKET